MVLIVKFFASLKTSQDGGHVHKWSRCFDPSGQASNPHSYAVFERFCIDCPDVFGVLVLVGVVYMN